MDNLRLDKNERALKDNKKEFKIEFSLNGNADKIPLGKKSFCISPFNKKYLKGNFPQDSKRLAYVDLSNFIHKKLTVRNRQQHDVFKPLGFLSEVKLKKYLINKKVQTPGFKASHYLKEVSKFIGRDIFDYIIINSGKPSEELIKAYAAEGELIENDLEEDSRVMATELLNSELKEVQKGDVLTRNLIRHDSHKLAKELMSIVDNL